jgi:hypothetical protein
MTPSETADFKKFTFRIDVAIADAERCDSDPTEILGGILEDAMKSVVFVHVKRYCGRRLAALRAKRTLAQAQVGVTARSPGRAAAALAVRQTVQAPADFVH